MPKTPVHRIFSLVQRISGCTPVPASLLAWLLMCLLPAAAIGTVAAGFLVSLDWVTTFRERHPAILWGLPAAGFLIGCLYHYFGRSVVAGNNLVIDVLHGRKATVPFRMAPMVWLSTLVTHLFGGSAGREGTALQMAAAIAAPFCRLYRLKAEDRRILITAAVAAGFGAVFGTPLAGTLFSLEWHKARHLRYRALFPAWVSAMMADQVVCLWQVRHSTYRLGPLPEWSFRVGGSVCIAALLFGACAWVFSHFLHRASALCAGLVRFPPLRPLAGGLLLCLLTTLSGTMAYSGLGIPGIMAAFLHPAAPVVFVLKIVFTVLTLATGFKGGEVTPLFFIGASLGSALAIVLPLPVGLLAGMGFVAVFAAATKAPLAAVLMAVELFGPGAAVYMAIACTVAYLTSGHNSIYGVQVIGGPKHPRRSGQEGRRMDER